MYCSPAALSLFFLSSTEHPATCCSFRLYRSAPHCEFLRVSARIAVSGLPFWSVGCCRRAPLVALSLGISALLQLRSLADSADLEALLVLVENLFAVVLPERLGRVAAGHALQDLGAAGVLVNEA